MWQRCESAETLTMSEFGVHDVNEQESDNWSKSVCGFLRMS
jgi:hypothetical protein